MTSWGQILAITSILNLFITSYYVSKAEAFQCYVCDSKNDLECTENLSDNSRLVPKDCNNINGAKYCIKTTNIYAGESQLKLNDPHFGLTLSSKH